jgi:hypothetical protein
MGVDRSQVVVDAMVGGAQNEDDFPLISSWLIVLVLYGLAPSA